MKRTRRVEITAFRRQVTIYCGDEHRIDAHDPSPSRDESRPNIDATDRLMIDLGEGRDAILDAARAGELSLLAEAVIESGGNTSVAVRRLGLSRGSFYSQLRKLGLSLRQLKARLNLMSHLRATKSMGNNKERAQAAPIKDDSPMGVHAPTPPDLECSSSTSGSAPQRMERFQYALSSKGD